MFSNKNYRKYIESLKNKNYFHNIIWRKSIVVVVLVDFLHWTEPTLRLTARHVCTSTLGTRLDIDIDIISYTYSYLWVYHLRRTQLKQICRLETNSTTRNALNFTKSNSRKLWYVVFVFVVVVFVVVCCLLS